MTSIRTLALTVVACVAFASGCSCGTPSPNSDGGTDSGCAGASCSQGDGGGDLDGGDDAGVDAGPVIIPTDPGDPNNPNKDSDCDGLSDAEEYANVFPGGKQTAPGIADTDGDGIKDGVELGRTTSVDPNCGFVGDADPASHTIPTEIDSDGDGLLDGLEDANHDGALSPGETDATSPDSDGDQLADGAEDANHNGVVDADETNPRAKDTDGDGINDGVERNITHTDPIRADTDGDTCSDGAEDTNQNGIRDNGESDPKDPSDCGTSVPDADSDGLPDSIEDVNGNGMYDPPNETDLHKADTDGDGLPDGVEDKNHNGQVNAGETDPRRKDTDCDGLIDGPTAGPVLGEDLNGNGVLEAGETDPTKADTDGDGLTDGVERGITANPDPTYCPGVILDADPGQTTDPTVLDSDGDGIADGAEDTNQNGRHDSGELDPKNAADGTGPAGQACTAANLRPVLFDAEGAPDVQLGLPTSFTEVTPMVVGGTTRGMMGYDPTRHVAFLVYKTNAPASNAIADEAAIRGSLGGVSNVNTQPFTTWDGYDALQAFYDQANNGDLKTRANALADALVGNGAGVLFGTAGVNGPFKIQAEYVHRSNQSLIVLIALAKQTEYADPAQATLFSISDAAGGSALAQFGDGNAVQCETFTASNAKVDFLFVVDDSCSMASYQGALATAASAMAAKLSNAIDYRLGLVTTSYYRTSGTNAKLLRGFTTDVPTFQGWLTENTTCQGGVCKDPANNTYGTCTNQNQCWVSTSGNGTENALESARQAVEALAPAAPNNPSKVRTDAQLVIVVLGDADDQYTSVSIQTYANYFNNTGTTAGVDKNSLNQAIPVHGIICPAGQTCGETQNNPRRIASVISATQGVTGDINDPGGTSIATTINTIVDSAIAAAGYKTQKPPIGASVKVAMDAVLDGANCNKNDLPRSRINGFDVDGKAGTISFFGACRPATNNTPAAVSYRYWIDNTPSPNGNPPPCSQDTSTINGQPVYDPTDPDHCRGNLVCNLTTNLCECPADCGGNPPPGMVCNPNKQVCDFVCTPDCGGTCSGYQTCDQGTCSCVCVQNATCAPGFTFVNDGTRCGCFCDTAALGCGPTYEADADACACVCKPDCGGCEENKTCNPTSCVCTGGIN
ncbi:MAG: VWA domain-containing protein [Myxococcaceae bacterium]|nr:VWA domain-containing protein [Myxococcaceae bacterium]